MPRPQPESADTPTFEEVAAYLRDMSGQLAGMAHGAGLHEAARALASARELCDRALGEAD